MFGLITSRPTYNPFRELEAMERALFAAPTPSPTMRTDLIDQGDAYLLEAELPGYDKKDISLQLENDTLTIRAERKREERTEQEKYLRTERTWGSCQRRFDITGIRADKIKAKYRDGILRITLPKKEELKAVTLEIE